MRHLPSAIAVLLLVSVVQGVTFTVPLDVAGDYPPQTRYFSFDLGTPLLSVQSASVQWEGTVVAARDGYGTPKDGGFMLSLNALNYWCSSPRVGADTWPAAEPFAELTHLRPMTSSSWDFLLDGAAEGYIELDVLGRLFDQPPPLSQYSGHLNSATLVIEATPAPEPQTAMLLASAWLLCRWPHRKH